ncbi:MAG: hydroxymethylbilane synthase [Planctomycetaceae bacterium]|nr:hydroxymethylbilane synthase [Planctomycetaceae bacterium]
MSDSEQTLRIATRASDLALWQAEHVADLIRQLDQNLQVELVRISTHGDREQKEALHQMGGVGVFTREVQKAVLDNEADIAVHSLKDLPTQTAEGLVLAGVPARASVFDALVLPKGSSHDFSWDSLPEGAKIGTGSLRRQAQLRHLRPDLQLAEIRGNVPTRIRKLDEGEYDALILAIAGLERLNLADRISLELGPPEIFPAVGQGALGIECRSTDERTISLLNAITNPGVFASVTAERALLAELEAGCHAPLGALSTLNGDQLTLQGVVLDPAGTKRIEATYQGPITEAVQLGHQAARELFNQGAADLMGDSPA